ncbi:MAG: MarR family transcriptional regulator [Rhodobacteraceae bacterium]|nr:MarR family transcriptional regulator [Paracoccaceae bacterium]
MDEHDQTLYFRLFNEIGILEQISRTFLEVRLPDGFIAPHFAVLNHLIRVKDGRTPLELARAFQVPKTTMTHTLAGLEKGGLVEMKPNPEDGRSKRVWITHAGRSFRNRAIADLSPLFGALAEAFPPDTVAQMMPELERLRIFMDDLRDRVS